MIVAVATNCETHKASEIAGLGNAAGYPVSRWTPSRLGRALRNRWTELSGAACGDLHRYIAIGIEIPGPDSADQRGIA